MFNAAAIKDLQDEKALLVAGSEINRRALQLEFSKVQDSVLRAKETVKIGVGIYPLIMVVGSLLGFLFLRKKKFAMAPSLFGKIIAGWNIFQRIRGYLSANRADARRGEISTP